MSDARVTVETLHPSGALAVSAFIDDRDGFGPYLKREVFYGYTRREAVAAFVGTFGRSIVWGDES